MENLQIKISKKGTRVVTASNLYAVLELPGINFLRDFRKWLEDVYEFKDGIRSPRRFRDYSKRVINEGHIIEDYFLTVELAKLITLKSRSKYKRKFAQLLKSHEGVQPLGLVKSRRKRKEIIPVEGMLQKTGSGESDKATMGALLTLW